MPVTGKQRGQLSVEYILSKISEYDIYRFYLGHDFVPGEAMLSPFRKEENPSFTIRLNTTNEWRHKDWSDSEKCGGCIDFVMQLFNEDFYSSLRRIDKDFGLGIIGKNQAERDAGLRPPIPPPIPREPTLIQVVAKPFTQHEIDYWARYHITLDELNSNNIYSIKRLYVNRKLFPLEYSDITFGYLFGDKWKIYRPMLDKKRKWMSNVPQSTISGWGKIEVGKQMGYKIALITKAKKDEIILSKIIPTTCSTQNESNHAISKDKISFLQENFEEVWINFDSDETGVKECKYYNQFGFKWINCPKGYTKPDGSIIKDFADLARYHGLDTVVDYFKSKNLIQ